MNRYACIACRAPRREGQMYCDDCLADMHPCAWPSCPTLLRGDATVCRFHAKGKTIDLARARRHVEAV